jgi:hypothetical protein
MGIKEPLGLPELENQDSVPARINPEQPKEGHPIGRKQMGLFKNQKSLRSSWTCLCSCMSCREFVSAALEVTTIKRCW